MSSKSFYHALIKPSLFLLLYHCFLCIDFILRQDLCTCGQSWPQEADIVCIERKNQHPLGDFIGTVWITHPSWDILHSYNSVELWLSVDILTWCGRSRIPIRRVCYQRNGRVCGGQTKTLSYHGSLPSKCWISWKIINVG